MRGAQPAPEHTHDGEPHKTRVDHRPRGHRYVDNGGAEGGDVTVEILKAGRRLVVGRITITDRASGKLAADLSSTYARL